MNVKGVSSAKPNKVTTNEPLYSLTIYSTIVVITGTVWKRCTNGQAFILFLCYQRYSLLQVQTLHCQVFFCQLQQWVIRMLFMQYSDHSGTTTLPQQAFTRQGHSLVHYLHREILMVHAEVRVKTVTRVKWIYLILWDKLWENRRF